MGAPSARPETRRLEVTTLLVFHDDVRTNAHSQSVMRSMRLWPPRPPRLHGARQQWCGHGGMRIATRRSQPGNLSARCPLGCRRLAIRRPEKPEWLTPGRRRVENVRIGALSDTERLL